MTVVDEVELQPAPRPQLRRAAQQHPNRPRSKLIWPRMKTRSFCSNRMVSTRGISPRTPRPQHEPTRRGRGLTSSKTARFEIELQRAPQAAPARRGLIKDFLLEKARAIILKFAAHEAVGPTMEFLERNVRRGLVVMDSDDPQNWRLVENISAVTLPRDRPARLLLFVHGTFSSTVGSFGGLGATPWGRAFLEAARANYDAVIGFDHATLAEDPLTNARDLLQRMQFATFAQPPRIDTISYSRGGLVLRSLLESLLPNEQTKPDMTRAIFVAVVNGGTLLAKPENWHTLIDLYTNIAAAACRIVALFPQVNFAAILTREIVQSVGAFAKYLADEAVTKGGIPGLAAMDPDSTFIRELNETQPGQPTIAASEFYAVLSQFDAKIAAQSPKEIPRQLFLALTNGLIDQLMHAANDLVVNTASMTMIDPAAGNFIKDRLDFGANAITYHTNYFLQPQTVNALTRWLKLQPPQTAAPSLRRNFTPPGVAVRREIPAHVDTDVSCSPRRRISARRGCGSFDRAAESRRDSAAASR